MGDRVFGLIGRSSSRAALTNLREMCDRIRFVSLLVCPRREGQLVRPRLRQGLKPLSQRESPLKRTEELVDVHRFEANLESVSTHILHHSQEQAGKPVHKKLIENGATSQFQPTLAMRRGFQPPAGRVTNPSEYCTNTQIPDFWKKSVI